MPSHIDFLRTLNIDVLFLQEVSEKFFNSLKQEQIFNQGFCSLDYKKNRAEISKARNLGCAIFVSQNVNLYSPHLLEKLPFPERSLVCNATMTGHSFKICSFHVPPGASWKKLKPESQVQLAKWLANRSTPVILGIDANSPKLDHPEYSKNVWWWPDEPKLLGEDRIHDLKDVLRDYLSQHPDKFQAIRDQRPEGPLATSHIRGNHLKKTESRYDFIFVSPEFDVHNVEYLFEEALEAGSDHALVLAEVTPKQ